MPRKMRATDRYPYEEYTIPNAPTPKKKEPCSCYNCGRNAKKNSELSELLEKGWIFVRKGQVDSLMGNGPIVALCSKCHVL